MPAHLPALLALGDRAVSSPTSLSGALCWHHGSEGSLRTFASCTSSVRLKR
jgi:hypothetical protein